ncbi:MAG: PEGA domain-containing protein [Candidatus Zixiibacteriota bacterium]|nr:MAG: PEGA domain-containing protein [candidate division Zixibacteria bacterium]
MRVRKSVVAILATLVIPVAAASQTGMTGDLTVRSVPQGASVRLSGGATVSGVTPARFRHLLIGDYELSLKKDGYETYRTTIELDPSKQMEMDIKLSPKTRFKTAVRSIFIPGWGQRYADKKTKGFIFTALTVVAGVGYLFADDEYDYRYDEYVRLRDEFDSLSAAGNVDDLRRIYPDLEVARKNAYDAETVRRITIGIGVGIWALNVIDALFFFPEQKGTFTVKGLSLTPSADTENVGLTLSMEF